MRMGAACYGRGHGGPRVQVPCCNPRRRVLGGRVPAACAVAGARFVRRGRMPSARNERRLLLSSALICVNLRTILAGRATLHMLWHFTGCDVWFFLEGADHACSILSSPPRCSCTRWGDTTGGRIEGCVPSTAPSIRARSFAACQGSIGATQGAGLVICAHPAAPSAADPFCKTLCPTSPTWFAPTNACAILTYRTQPQAAAPDQPSLSKGYANTISFRDIGS
jgi:hypothetical protein